MSTFKEHVGTPGSNGEVELTPDSLMAVATGFWATKTLTVAVELDVFGLLSGGPGMTVDEVAAALGIERRPADLLLAACASLGAISKNGGRYRNHPMTEEYLVPGRERYFGSVLRYMERRAYPAWGDLVTAVRTNRPVAWDPDNQDSVFSPDDEENVAVFWEATHTISLITARELAREVDLSGYRRLLDLGGGSATFGVELCRAYPQLTATSLDLPHVSEIAAAKVDQAGITDRVAVVSGDFFADEPLPGGHDVIILSSILHDWDEETNIRLLTKCYKALPPGGAVVISEFILDDDRCGPAGAALMGMHMLVETPGGKTYSEAEYTTWLTEAGFVGARRVHFTALAANGAIIAAKPGG